jgi:hypothetical protein
MTGDRIDGKPESAAVELLAVQSRRESRRPEWNGPFADPNMRLPLHPAAVAERRAATRRWRERTRARALEAAAVRTRDDSVQPAAEAAEA